MTSKPSGSSGRPRATAPAPLTPTLTVVADAAAPANPAPSATNDTIPTLEAGMKKMINTTEGLVAFSKENLEAFATSGKIWAAGLQDLSQQIAATAKQAMEESVATMKALTSVKSIEEAVALQSVYTQAVAKALAESNRLTDASLKLTEKTLAPLTARMAAAVGTLSKAA